MLIQMRKHHPAGINRILNSPQVKERTVASIRVMQGKKGINHLALRMTMQTAHCQCAHACTHTHIYPSFTYNLHILGM